MKIRWSEIAEADLADIHDHIARDVPYYAEQFVDRLIETVGALEDHPRSDDGYRKQKVARMCGS